MEVFLNSLKKLIEEGRSQGIEEVTCTALELIGHYRALELIKKYGPYEVALQGDKLIEPLKERVEGRIKALEKQIPIQEKLIRERTLIAPFIDLIGGRTVSINVDLLTQTFPLPHILL